MMVSASNDRIVYNGHQNVLLLNFEKLKLHKLEDLLQLQHNITNVLERIMKEQGKKVDCLVNYDFMDISDDLFQKYIDMCIKNTRAYFHDVSRYGTKDINIIKKLEDAFVRSRTIDPNIYEETIGNYVLRDKLGRGSFGCVRLALLKQTGQKFACKILDKETMDDNSVCMEFVHREIEIHSSLHHPNIVGFAESIETNSNVYLVIEYIKAQKLESLIESSPIAEDVARGLFMQLVDAIEYIHVQGVTHRDLHPGNILITSENQVKLIDFGCASRFNENTQFHEFVGKSQYAAPEMLLFKQKMYKGKEVDIWSLGVVLFKMVSGYEPFRYTANTLAMEFSLPLGEEPISEHCKDLIEKILVYQPEKRLDIQGIKNHPWFWK
jgi:serine/threonine protein kinase